MIGMSFWFPSVSRGYYLPFRHGYKPNAADPHSFVDSVNLPIEWLADIPFALPQHTYIGYNIIFDLTVLDREGLPIPHRIEDVWTAAFLLNENEDLTSNTGRSGAYGLKRLARLYLGDKTEGEENLYESLRLLGFGSKDRGNERHWKGNMWRLSAEQTSQYAIDDVRLTWELREFYRPHLTRWGQWDLYHERNEYYLKVAFRMERNGILVDPHVMEDLSQQARISALEVHEQLVAIAERLQAAAEADVFRAYPFNPRSSTGVKAMLNALGHNVENTTAATLLALADGGCIEAGEIINFRNNPEDAVDSVQFLNQRAVELGVIPAFDDLFIRSEILKQRFNPASPSQVQLLFMRQGVDLQSTEKATLEVLEKQGSTLAELILLYRTYSKAESTYYSAWRGAMDANNYIHTTMRNNTVTGRPNSYDPNLQNIPRKGKYPVKRALVAPDGYVVVEIDYKSQELFVAAHFAQCQSMGQLVSEGRDLHKYTTDNMGVRAILYPGLPDEKILHLMGHDNIPTLTTEEKAARVNKGLRQVGKILNFAIMYGAGANSLTKLLNVSRDEAYKLIDAWYSVYPEMKDLSEYLQGLAGTGRSPDGSPGSFHYHRNPDGLVRHFDAFHKAKLPAPTHVCLNVLVQGYSGTITRRAWLAIAAEFPNDDVMIPILNLYDATYAYVRKNAVHYVVPRMMDIMTDFDLNPRLQVEAEVGDNWEDKIPLEEWLGLSGRN